MLAIHFTIMLQFSAQGTKLLFVIVERALIGEGALISFLSYMSECGEILIKWKNNRYFRSRTVTTETLIVTC